MTEIRSNVWEILDEGGEGDGWPSPRANTAMAYHPGSGKIVLFGGKGKGDWLCDTWVWNPMEKWVEVNICASCDCPDAPSKRDSHSLALNGPRGGAGDLLLHGAGDNVANGTNRLDDTWHWDGSRWARLVPDSNTTEKDEPWAGDMAFYGDDGPMYRFVGEGKTVKVYRWTGTMWEPVTVEGGPQASVNLHKFQVDYLDGHGIVLFGGLDSDLMAGAYGDTWIFHCE